MRPTTFPTKPNRHLQFILYSGGFCAGIKKIDKSVYEEHVGTLFGHQPVTSLQLCSMNAPKHKETGYYKVLHQVQLHSAQQASADDSGNN